MTDLDGKDVAAAAFRLQQESRVATRNVLAADSYTAAYIFDDGFPGLGGNAVFDPSLDDFSSRLYVDLLSELQRIGLLGTRIAAPDAAGLENLARFVIEALDNTHKHARHDTSGRPIHGLRFLNIRRRLTRDMPIPASGTERGPKSLNNYLRTLEDRLAGQPVPLVEFTVADSGAGIAAHHAKDAGIYERELAQEFAALQAAFSNAGDPEVNWDGFGLYKMQLAAHGMGALLIVRAGRCLATQHYLDGDPGTKFVDDIELNDYELTLDESPRSHVSGTAVTVVVPWTSAFSSEALF